MILSIGEILVDVYQDEDEILILPGGAPFNVACNIADFGGEISFIGAVGEDEYGKMLSEFAGKKNFLKCKISKIASKSTTQAFVELIKGERNFIFKRDNAADYHLEIEEVSKFIDEKGLTIHLGSLLLTKDEGIDFVFDLLKLIADKEVKLSFDVNYRQDIFGTMSEYKQKLIPVIERANILKFSEEEILLFTGETTVKAALGTFGSCEKLIIVTLGQNGSVYYLRGLINEVATIGVVPIDTTGAGDAFYSYVLFSLDHKDHSLLSKPELNKIFYEANVVGALSTLKKGAIDVVPSIYELRKFIDNE